MPGRRRPSQPYSIHHIRTDRTPIPMATPRAAYVDKADGHIDVDETIKIISMSVEQLRAAMGKSTALDEASISSYEKKIKRARKWGGWIWGTVSVAAMIFTAGVTYAVFMGENATDSEVEEAIIEHNGGIDPESVDSVTRIPFGVHPYMRKSIESNTGSIKKIETEILPPIVESQKKLDKRSEYQFELGRWQSDVMEADRMKRRVPAKPDKLKELETDLALGKY